MSTLLTHFCSEAIRAALGKSIQPSTSAIANAGTVQSIEDESKGEKRWLEKDGGVCVSAAEGVRLVVELIGWEEVGWKQWDCSFVRRIGTP